MEASTATFAWPEAAAAGDPQLSAPTPATREPGSGATAARSATRSEPDEAVRWRVNAAVMDILIQIGIVLGVVVSTTAQGIRLSYLSWTLFGVALSWLYHFAYESQGGQTPGKKRFGVKVVRLDGGPAEPWRIAVRNLLRGVDEFGPLSASGLITMWLSGSARRQRIGDKAAGTIVVPVSGRDRRAASPRWLLPGLASLAILLGIGEVSQIVRASAASSQSRFETSFVAGCSATAPPNESCSCLYHYLRDRAGYRTPEQWNGLERRIEMALAAHDPSQLPPEYVSAALACRTR
ncbi:MAG TPA: RDD family protein [Solirubrobacteraceae bacterium]|jgi:uncharacterized RDD family membrane protein YckC|nr:RDD family protein [Solirubrobacteraceae bacterium]